MTTLDNPAEPETTNIDELMATVNRLGNDALVAQVRAALEIDGINPDGDFCKAAFIGCAYVLDLAERSTEAGALSVTEMVACQSVASLAMQVWATLHDFVTGQIEL